MIQRSELLADGCLLPAEAAFRLQTTETREKGGVLGRPHGASWGAHSEGLAP